MATLQQLTRKGRVVRKNNIKELNLCGGPHRKAVIYKITTMPPRKPNSAKRTIAKVRLLINNKRLFAKIPGIGSHYLQKHSIVLLRGHGPKDSPGINYHLVRGQCDFIEIEDFGRVKRRSKFGTKKFNN
jgi:small subunit ribosomal protein S12